MVAGPGYNSVFIADRKKIVKEDSTLFIKLHHRIMGSFLSKSMSMQSIL